MICRQTRDSINCVFDSEEELNHFYQREEDPIPVKADWRTAELGDWVWTDDLKIVQILNVKTMWSWIGKCKYNCYHTVVGIFPAFFTDMDSDFSRHPIPGSFGRLLSAEEIAAGVHRTKLPKKPKKPKPDPPLRVRDIAFMQRILMGHDPMDTYKIFYGVPKNYDDVPAKLAKFFNRAEVLQMARQDVMEAAEKYGITASYIVKKLKDIIEGAESRPKDVMASLRELIDILELKPEKTFRLRALPPGGPSGGEITEAEFKEIGPRQIANQSEAPVA